MSAAPIKICGITRQQDASAAARAGAGAIGINLYSRSPRYVPRHQVPAILAQVEISKIAVLVHPSPEELRATLDLDFDAFQIHAPNVRALARLLVEDGRPVIATAAVRTEEDLTTAQQAIDEWKAAGVALLALLVDAKVPGAFGGTGQVAPWELLRGQKFSVPLLLAGGLTPENVAQAIATVRPHGVDVASGVERMAGVKDPQRLEAFVANARAALAALHAPRPRTPGNHPTPQRHQETMT